MPIQTILRPSLLTSNLLSLVLLAQTIYTPLTHAMKPHQSNQPTAQEIHEKTVYIAQITAALRNYKTSTLDPFPEWWNTIRTSEGRSSMKFDSFDIIQNSLLVLKQLNEGVGYPKLTGAIREFPVLKARTIMNRAWRF